MEALDYIFDNCILYTNQRQKLLMCSRNRVGVVIVPDGVRFISDFAFYWCRAIEEIVLPDTIEYIGRYAFNGCKMLKKIRMSGVKIRYIDASNFISNITAKLLGEKYICVNDGIMYNLDKTVVIKCIDRQLEHVALPMSVFRIEDNAFAGCIHLKKIRLSVNTREIGSRAFSGCIELTQVQGIRSLCSIGDYAFTACEKLDLSAFDGCKINLGEYVFLR